MGAFKSFIFISAGILHEHWNHLTLYSANYGNYEVGTLATDGWAITFGTTRRGLSPPRPLLGVPNVTSHPSTASVPIHVLLYNGPLLCGFNVRVQGLKKVGAVQDLGSISLKL